MRPYRPVGGPVKQVLKRVAMKRVGGRLRELPRYAAHELKAAVADGLWNLGLADASRAAPAAASSAATTTTSSSPIHDLGVEDPVTGLDGIDGLHSLEYAAKNGVLSVERG